MPSLADSTPQSSCSIPPATIAEVVSIASELEAFRPTKGNREHYSNARNRLETYLEGLLVGCRKKGEPAPTELLAIGRSMGIRAASPDLSEAEAERVALKVIPDIRPGQARELASAKARIGKLAASLLEAQAEARAIVDALHNGHATPSGEPDYVELGSPEDVVELKPGRYLLEFSNAWRSPTARKMPDLFTRAGDDLAAEVYWATDVENQLTSMIERLVELASRDERQKLMRRRSWVVEYLSPGSCSTAQLAND